MPANPALLIAIFAVSGAVSLTASGVLVKRIERLSARWGLGPALIGLLAAFCADSPEMTSALSATLSGQGTVGAGVVFGSNVFNLAGLLGLSALVAGMCCFHRRVIVLVGGAGCAVAAVGASVAAGWLPALPGLLTGILVLAIMGLVSALPAERLRRMRLSAGVADWLATALQEEASEVEPAIREGRGHLMDALEAGAALILVVIASAALETTGVALGQRWHLSQALVGAVALGAVTSIPNAVTAVYLARRGRSAAVLSETFNSNSINIVIGLLLPAAILGMTHTSFGTMAALWALGLSLVALVIAYTLRGINRPAGAAIILGYAAFFAVTVST